MIILKDRPYFNQSIQIDLGQISVKSRLESIIGRWKNEPDKETIVNVMDINMNQVRIDFNEKQFEITPPFNMNIEIERVNYSELLIDEDFLTKSVNFELFDKADHITIQSTGFALNFKQEVYTYLLRVMDLNINYYDMQSEGYQLYCWDSHDYMKYLNLEDQVVEKYKDSSVYKRMIKMQFPSLSIKCLEDSQTYGKDHLLSELILYNLDLSMKMFLDYRKNIELQSHTFFLLFKDHKDSEASDKDIADPNYKSLIVGPIKSKKHIKTSNYFYNEMAD